MPNLHGHQIINYGRNILKVIFHMQLFISRLPKCTRANKKKTPTQNDGAKDENFKEAQEKIGNISGMVHLDTALFLFLFYWVEDTALLNHS